MNVLKQVIIPMFSSIVPGNIGQKGPFYYSTSPHDSPPPYSCHYRGGAILPSSPNNSNLKPSEPSSSSFSCHFFWWREIVYLGQIVSYLREKGEGASSTPAILFPNSSPSFSFFSTFFHPQHLHFGFQPFNQSVTIRADRATGNN